MKLGKVFVMVGIFVTTVALSNLETITAKSNDTNKEYNMPLDKQIELNTKLEEYKLEKERVEEINRKYAELMAKKEAERLEAERLAEEARLAEEKRLEEERIARENAIKSEHLYSLEEFLFIGRVYWGEYEFTYYSESVLPGGGLDIPGRTVNELGYVVDIDGYIVLANDCEKGTIIDTPFGYKGKVYDRGTYGNHFDVYIR